MHAPLRPSASVTQKFTPSLLFDKVVVLPRWRNWYTHYLEVVAPKGLQVQLLSWAQG